MRSSSEMFHRQEVLRRRLIAGYLLAQAIAVPLWWAGISASPGFRAWFELGDPTVLDGFRLADVGLAAISFVAGWAVLRRRRGAGIATGITLGAVAYGTALTISAAFAAGRGSPGVVAMLLATAGTAGCLLRLRAVEDRR